MDEKVSIANLSDGVAIQLIDEALEHAYANIRDPNTDATAKRTIDLKITLTPDSDREIIVLNMECSKKFANDRPVGAKIMLGFDGGVLIAEELRSRQTDIEEYANVKAIKGESKLSRKRFNISFHWHLPRCLTLGTTNTQIANYPQ